MNWRTAVFLTLTFSLAGANGAPGPALIFSNSFELPADPSTLATPPREGVPYDIFTETAFLYTPPNPIQFGVNPDDIDPARVAVVRGRVMDSAGDPLGGARISILDHPELGFTLSRADGWFDMVVNGGGPLSVQYDRSGRLPAERVIDVPIRDFVSAPDVVLIALSTRVDTVGLTPGAPLQTARGEVVSDADGERQATILFPEGSSAQLVMNDGGTAPITTLNVRATEYTVGPMGLQAMPAPLPTGTEYTYAVELSVDEAMAAGAASVQFDQPLPFYVENYLGLPVGSLVPSGYYDRKAAAWMPSEDGIVIGIIDTAAGRATVDLNGDAAAESENDLLAFGFSLPELDRLATLYQPGDSLWRVPIEHFTPFDLNLPGPPEPDVLPPENVIGQPGGGGGARNQPAGPNDVAREDACDQLNSSFIGCQIRTVGERIPLTGTPYTLTYRSDRTAGRVENRSLTLRLVNQLPLTQTLKQVFLTVRVAGQVIEQTFDNPQAGLTVPFVWDGLDAYGRRVRGPVPVAVEVGYLYEMAYCVRPYSLRGLDQLTFSRLCQIGSSEIVERTTALRGFTTRERTTLLAGSPDDVAGWTIDAHHHYSTVDRSVFLGDGTRVAKPAAVEALIESVIGGGPSREDGVSGDQVQLGSDVWGLAVGSDGSIYFSLEGELVNDHRVRKVDPSGIVSTVAGQFQASGFAGDGGPATEALLNAPRAVAVGPDDSVYVIDFGNSRVRHIDANGIITTVAGGGSETELDGALATDVALPFPTDLEVATDGALFLTVSNGAESLLRIGADGRIQTLPNFGGLLELTADNEPITASGGCISRALAGDLLEDACWDTDISVRTHAFAMRPDGTFFLGDQSKGCIRRFEPLETLVGPPSDEQPLTSEGDATYRFRLVQSVGLPAVNRDPLTPEACGDDFSDRTRGDGGPAAAGWTGGFIPGMTVAPNGDLYLVDVDYFLPGTSSGRIRRVRSPFQDFNGSDILVPSPDDAIVFRFDAAGRHLETISALTGAVLRTFEYDAAGRLVTLLDAYGNETTIERGADGRPTAIVAPFGQRTTLQVNSDGYLSMLSNPADESYAFTYTPEGLITGITNPAGIASSYSYTAEGELVTATAGDGFQQTLEREPVPRGFQVTRTTGLGRSTSHVVAFTADRELELVNTDERGAETLIRKSADNTTTVTRPTGMVETSSLIAHPQFGVQQEGGELYVLESPAGRRLEVVTQRETTLANQNDPLSLTSTTMTRSIGGRTVSAVYDAATRTITTTSPTGRLSTRILDSLGRTISTSPGSAIAPVTYTYDAVGRLVGMAQSGDSISYEYDALGRLTVERNAIGDERSYTYDNADRPISLTSPGGRVYTFTYSPLGELTSLTMPNGAVHNLTYTAFSENSGYLAPDAGALVQQYDADRRRVAMSLPDGRGQIFAYDSQHRSNAITFDEGRVDFTYAGLTLRADTLARTDNQSGLTHTIDYDYDGELVTAVAMQTDQLVYSYDPDFRLSGIQLNAEPAWTYLHDDDDLVVGYGPFTITRDGPAGRPNLLTDGVLSISYSFDDRGRLTERSYRMGAEQVYTLQLAYGMGTERIERRTETVAATSTIFDYTYTPDGELATVVVNGGPASTYGYDVNGNRTATDAGSASYDVQDRLTSREGIVYIFDDNGVLFSRGTDTFEYSARGELLAFSQSGGVPVTYSYDAIGRRVARTDVSGTTSLIYGDPGNPFLLLASRAPDGTLTRYFYDESDVLIALERGGNRFYVASDQVGSPRLVLNASGDIIKTMTFDAFGVLLSDSNPGFDLPIGFAGGIADPVSGLVRFGFRDYEPASGRWTARDPLLFDAGQPNLYAYANSNPVSLRDPTGLLCVGFEAYEGYGAGIKTCYKDGKWSICAETGFAVGGGFSLDLVGKPAGRGDRDYVSATAGLECGPAKIGGEVKIDDCGDFKACVQAETTFKLVDGILGLGGAGKTCQNFLTGKTESGLGPTGKASLADVNVSNGPGTFGLGKDLKVGKASCKGSVGIKAGACLGSDTF